MHLLTLDVSLEEARVVRVRGDFGLHDSGGCHVIFLLPVNSGGGGEELVGSEQRNPAGGEEVVVVVRRENQILRRHESLVGVLRRHSVHSIHNQQRHETKRCVCFASFLTRISGTFFWLCCHCPRQLVFKEKEISNTQKIYIIILTFYYYYYYFRFNRFYTYHF